VSNADLVAFIKKHPLGIACGAIALLFAGATYYRRSVIPEVTSLLDEKVTESARISANIKNAAQLTDQLAKVTEADKAVEGRLVQASQLANNLQYFYRLEAETGTKLIELRQNPPSARTPATKGAFSGVSFSVALQGEYVAILDVFRRLETGAHFCRVTAAGITSAGPDRNSPLKLTLAVELLGQP
jgi:hypothetical protein